MDSKEYLRCLRSNRRLKEEVVHRQALCYFLFNKNISATIISGAMKISRKAVYLTVYTVRDLLEVGDELMIGAVKELENHDIKVKPYTVEGDVITRHAGYKLVVDNEIF